MRSHEKNLITPTVSRPEAFGGLDKDIREESRKPVPEKLRPDKSEDSNSSVLDMVQSRIMKRHTHCLGSPSCCYSTLNELKVSAHSDWIKDKRILTVLHGNNLDGGGGSSGGG